MKIPITSEPDLSSFDQEIQNILSQGELGKLETYFKTNLSKILTNEKRILLFTVILNKIDETLEKSIQEYKEYIYHPEETYSKNKEAISRLEDTLNVVLDVLDSLSGHADVVELFSSLEWLLELLPLSASFPLIRKDLEILYKYFSYPKLSTEALQNYKEKLGRFVHQVSMLALHRNLYNKSNYSLVELFCDDPKFKELSLRQGDKFFHREYKDNLDLEYFTMTGVPEVQEADKKPKPAAFDFAENIVIKVNSLKTAYPNDSHYAICKKIIKDQKLVIEDDSPIFDALLFRIRVALHFESYKYRQEIAEVVLSSLALIGLLRRVSHFKKYESFIFQGHDLIPILDEILDLFYLNLTPSFHVRIWHLLLKVANKYGGAKHRHFFASNLNHTEILYLVFKDLTSAQLKVENNDPSKIENVSTVSQPLILSKECVNDPQLLTKALKVISKVYEEFYYDSRSRVFYPDVDVLGHIISNIMVILTPIEQNNLFLYSRKAMLNALKILRLLIFHKGFVRDYNIIEGLIQCTENLFKLLINDQKAYWREGTTWTEYDRKKQTELLIELTDLIIYYFVPIGNHFSRAEMAPTIARKVAESGIIKASVAYLEKNTEVDDGLYKNIMRLVSELCRESQTLVPRLIEAGIMELLLKKAKAEATQNEDIGDVMKLVSNLCLQEVGRTLEQKYQIIEMFFDMFTKDEFNTLNEKWFKGDAQGYRRSGQLEKAQKELLDITKYIDQYSNKIIEGITRTALFLIEHCEKFIKEICKIEKKPVEEGKPDQTLEEIKTKFSFIFYRISNFLIIYTRYLRDARIRANLFKNGAFDILNQLYSIYQIFFPDYTPLQTKVSENYSYLIQRELDINDTFVGSLQTSAVTEIDKIEIITGNLKNLKDFSKFVDLDFCEALRKDSLLKALYTSSKGSFETFNLMRCLSMASTFLFHLVNLKLVLAAPERIFMIYCAYTIQQLEMYIDTVEKFQKDKDSKSDPKSVSILFDSLALDKWDVLSRGYSYYSIIKAFVDRCIYYDVVNQTGRDYQYLSVILQSHLQRMKSLGDVPSTKEDKLLWNFKNYLIIDSINGVIANSTASGGKGKLYQTSIPSFILALYEEGGYDLITLKLQEFLRLIEKDLSDPIKPDENLEYNSIYFDSFRSRLSVTNDLFDKLFLPEIHHKVAVKYDEKQIGGIALIEHTNFVWLSHTKIVQHLADNIAGLCALKKKISEMKISQEEVKDAKEENKDKKPDETTLKLEKIKDSNLKAIKQFIDTYFKVLSRLCNKQTTPEKEPEAPKVNKEVEKIVKEVSEMGFNPHVVRKAIKKAQFLNHESVIDWITSHPEEVERFEKEIENQNKPAESQLEEISQLGNNKTQRITNDEFIQSMIKNLEDIDYKLISGLNVYEGYEKNIIKLVRKSIQYHEKNNKKNYSQQISLMFLKLLKHTVNHYFKGSKFISSLKTYKGLDKDFGNEIIKAYTSENTSVLAKVKNLELAIIWFVKLKSSIPMFDKNIIKSDFLSEIMNFYDHFLNNLDEILNLPEEERKRGFEFVKTITYYLLKVFKLIATLRHNKELDFSFSFDRKSDKEKDKEKSFDDADKKSKTKETRPRRTTIHRKTPLEVIIGIVSTYNNLMAKEEPYILLESKSIHSLFDILSIFLQEGSDNCKTFINKKGLQEILKMKTLNANPNLFIEDISSIVMSLIEENSLITATLESRIKAFLTQQSKKIKDVPLNSFMNHFKSYYTRNQKLILDVVQKLCVLYTNESEKPEEKKTSKKRVDPKSVADNRFIKLKPTVELSKLHCLKKVSDRKSQKPTSEIDLSEGSPSQLVAYTPSSIITQALGAIIDSIVVDFSNEFISTVKETEPTHTSLLPYHILIKILLLICSRYPLLLTNVFTYNCAALIPKEASDVPLLRNFVDKSNFTFLSYYLRVINYVTLDKLRYFIVESACCQDILIERGDKEMVPIGEQIGQEIIKELQNILQEEVSKPDFLETPESVQTVCSSSSLLLSFIPIRHLFKIILGDIQKENPPLLALYSTALKRLRLKNYYKLENVLPFIIEILSVLIQYYNYVILKQPDLTALQKNMPNDILIKKNYGDIWTGIVSGQSQPDIQDRPRNGREGFDFYNRLLNLDEEEGVHLSDLHIGGYNYRPEFDGFRGQVLRGPPPGVARLARIEAVHDDYSSDAEDVEDIEINYVDGNIAEEESIGSDEEGGHQPLVEEDVPQLVDGASEGEENQQASESYQQSEPQDESGIIRANEEEIEDEDINERTERSEIILDRKGKKKPVYSQEILNIINQTTITDPDLKKINTVFVDCSKRLEDIFSTTQSISNTSFYDAKSHLKVHKSSKNVYASMYHRIESEVVNPEVRPLHRQDPDFLFNRLADAEELLRQLEGRIHHDRNDLQTLRRLVHIYQNEREADRNYYSLNPYGRAQEQPQEDISSFANDLLQTLDPNFHISAQSNDSEPQPSTNTNPNPSTNVNAQNVLSGASEALSRLTTLLSSFGAIFGNPNNNESANNQSGSLNSSNVQSGSPERRVSSPEVRNSVNQSNSELIVIEERPREEEAKIEVLPTENTSNTTQTQTEETKSQEPQPEQPRVEEPKVEDLETQLRNALEESRRLLEGDLNALSTQNTQNTQNEQPVSPQINTEGTEQNQAGNQPVEDSKQNEEVPPTTQTTENTQNQNAEAEPESESDFPFNAFGIDKKFLEECGVDMTIFDMLPQEEKEEFVLQLLEQQSTLLSQSRPPQTTQNTNNNAQSNPQPGEESKAQDGQPSGQNVNPSNTEPNNANPSNPNPSGINPNDFPGIDPEILANLDQFPEDLRMDILRQQQLARQAFENPPQNTGEFDPVHFLETLDPALRQEILATSDQNFIDTLPSHLAAEAQMLQDSRMNRYENDLLQPQRNEPSEPPLNFIEKNLKKEQKEDALELQTRLKLYESDEKLIESLLKLIYVESSRFAQFPFNILNALSQHPKNEYKIFDTLMFLLKNDEMGYKSAANEGEDEFPPQALYERNRIMRDKDVIYSHVSGHILYLLFCLTQDRSNYFVETENKEDNIEDLALPSLDKRISLNSINAIKAELKSKETVPLFELLRLCTKKNVTKNPTNVALLVQVIENICRNPKIFKNLNENEEESPVEEEKKEGDKKVSKKKKEREKVLICKFKLDEEAVTSFCQLFYSEHLNNIIITKLSYIIGVFCQEKSNLDLFIKVMKNIMYKVSLESNKFLEHKLVEIKVLMEKENIQHDEATSNRLRDLLNEIVGKFGNQLPILTITKIIKDLYENTVKYIKDKTNYEKRKQRAQKDQPKEGEAPKRKESLKDEIFHKTKEQIIHSLESIMLDENLNVFWINVSEVVYYINEKLAHNLDIQNLLNSKVRPIIESFFIIHKILNDEEYTEYKAQTTKVKASIAEFATDDTAELEQPDPTRGFSDMKGKKVSPNELFTFMCEKNKKVINNMIKQDFNLLNDSMSMITKKVPKILEFEIRRAYFKKELQSLQRPGSIRIRVNRQKLMEGSFSQIYSRSADELRRKLHVEFIGEEGMDAGGLSREWFLEISKQVFNPNYNLFIPSANGNTFQPSLISDPENLNYFKFIGKVIGKALFDGQLLECYFTRSFYKHILGQRLTYHDIEDLDPTYYKSLKWMMENDISQAGLDLTFSYEKDKFGQTIIEDLIPNGRNIPVTEENKKEYINLICQAKMASGIKAQIESFLSGFFELIPKHLIAIFDSKELELLISGLPDIDIIDLKENTEYHGYEPDHQVIRWFWEVLEDMDHTQRANFLQFVTGTSKVPLEGFKALRGISGPQKFQIHKAGDINSLPTGHTCFNQLDLAPYPTKEILKSKLLLAITEGKEGFGFA